MEEQKKNPAQGLSESEQVQVRRQKLADLQAAGRDPLTFDGYFCFMLILTGFCFCFFHSFRKLNHSLSLW